MSAHDGEAVEGRPWTSRLIVVEIAGLAALSGDQDVAFPYGITFPIRRCRIAIW